MPDSPPVPTPRGARRATGATGATDTKAPRTPSEAARQAAADVPADTGGIGGTGGGGAGAAPKTRPTRTPALEAKLQQMFAMPALAFSAAGDQYCAEVWNARAPMVASAWFELSKQNPAVKRILEQLVEGSAWGGVVMSTLALALPIAKHHGVYRGPDPFAAFLPGPQAPPPPTGSPGGPGRVTTWSKDPSGPIPAPFMKSNGQPDSTAPASGDDAPPTYLEGAPPGVVTVAASNAHHNGAR